MIEFLILLMVLVFSCVVLFVAFCVNSLFVWFGQWSNSYHKLCERYRGLVKVGNLFFPPSLTFRHGESNCALRNKDRRLAMRLPSFPLMGMIQKSGCWFLPAVVDLAVGVIAD